MTELKATVQAAGKINLQLRVGPAGDDGYHELATIFQSVSIYDYVSVGTAPAGLFPVTVTGEQAHLVPADHRNLAAQTLIWLAEMCGSFRTGMSVEIEKNIPVTGGMAGGSADAAGALLAACVLRDLPYTPDEMVKMAAHIGADVPFCVLGGTALGVNRGDVVTSVLTRGEYHWVLAFSDSELSTPQVFREFDKLFPNPPQPKIEDDFLAALAAGDIKQVGKLLVNDLQPAALSLMPSLQGVLDEGMDAGALGGIVSGSGPTCAFLAAKSRNAKTIETALLESGKCRDVKRVRGPARGVSLVNL